MVHHPQDRAGDVLTAAGRETIAAVATPPGRGGVGIVRVSGSQVPLIAPALLGELPPARRALVRSFLAGDGTAIDQGLALYFPAPHSFTGEHVLELHGHGGPVVLDLLLTRILELGARLARPGEFSERAFLNGKLDLAQAEAIADLIDSASRQAARLALRSLQGEFSARVRALVDALVELRTYVEGAIDFADEEIDFLGEGAVEVRLGALLQATDGLVASARQGALLREGLIVVLAGRPNTGKSTLLNALAGREAAIVTEIPGTTRDVLRERILIDGMPLHVIDTAGLRESADPVEQEGIRRAWAEMALADRILLLIDDRAGLTPEDRALLARLPDGPGVTVIRNKIDLSGRPSGVTTGELGAEVALSAQQGTGLDALRDHLKTCAGLGTEEGLFMARRRHLDALRRARADIEHGAEALRTHGAGELVAEELRQAQRALGEITGEFTSDDLLGRIFASFCIGK